MYSKVFSGFEAERCFGGQKSFFQNEQDTRSRATDDSTSFHEQLEGVAYAWGFRDSFKMLCILLLLGWTPSYLEQPMRWIVHVQYLNDIAYVNDSALSFDTSRMPRQQSNQQLLDKKLKNVVHAKTSCETVWYPHSNLIDRLLKDSESDEVAAYFIADTIASCLQDNHFACGAFHNAWKRTEEEIKQQQQTIGHGATVKNQSDGADVQLP